MRGSSACPKTVGSFPVCYRTPAGDGGAVLRAMAGYEPDPQPADVGVERRYAATELGSAFRLVMARSACRCPPGARDADHQLRAGGAFLPAVISYSLRGRAEAL